MTGSACRASAWDAWKTSALGASEPGAWWPASVHPRWAAATATWAAVDDAAWKEGLRDFQSFL